MKNKIKRHWETILVIFLLLASLAVRLYKINAPLADWHSWRQADTASVSKYLLKDNFDILRPRFHDLSRGPSKQANPEGWRFVEFPIYNILHAGLAQISPWNFEVSGRLVSILASLTAELFIYLIIRRIWGVKTGLAAMFVFGFLPFNIYYSRTILPGPLAVCLSLGAVFYYLKFSEEKTFGSEITAIILAMLALLVKPYSVFIFALPFFYLSLLVLWRNCDDKKTQIEYLLHFFFGAVVIMLPFILWRVWLQKFPAGIPTNRWLLNAGGMRLKPVWWRWMFYERIGKLILGAWGGGFLLMGSLFRREIKSDIFALSFLVGSLLYLIIFARGNIQHDYYQVMIIPALTIGLARGVSFAWQKAGREGYRYWSQLVILTGIFFTLAFSWFRVKTFYQINNPAIVKAGQRADELLPDQAKVVAPYGGDTAFLYQTNRSGWPILLDPLEAMRKKGATHLVAVKVDETIQQALEEYQILEKTDEYVIMKLEEASD